jgi:hypothetical protein
MASYFTMRTRILYPFVFVLFLAGSFVRGVSAEPFRGPWEEEHAKEASCERAPNGYNPLLTLVKVYAKYISPVDGKECPMYPSCSTYSRLCFEKHGLIMGWVMTCDRLLHEADEMRTAAVVYSHGAQRFYDPLENNDFWWHHER